MREAHGLSHTATQLGRRGHRGMDQIPHSHACSDVEEEREVGGTFPGCWLGQLVAEGTFCRREDWAGEGGTMSSDFNTLC